MQKMKNLKTRKLYIQVYDEIKQYIQENRLQPGDKLPTEMEMCELLGVSRNVLREAVKTLEITGVVRSKPGVGMIIQKFSPDYLFSNLLINLAGDSEDLFWQTMEVRRALELSFAEQAYESLTEPQYLNMRDQVRLMRKTMRKYAAMGLETAMFGTDFGEADARFHKALFSGVDNAILNAVMNAVWVMDTNHEALYPMSYIGQTVERHEAIAQAFGRKDLPAFIASMNTHFDYYKPPVSMPGTDGAIPWKPHHNEP